MSEYWKEPSRPVFEKQEEYIVGSALGILDRSGSTHLRSLDRVSRFEMGSQNIGARQMGFLTGSISIRRVYQYLLIPVEHWFSDPLCVEAARCKYSILHMTLLRLYHIFIFINRPCNFWSPFAMFGSYLVHHPYFVNRPHFATTFSSHIPS